MTERNSPSPQKKTAQSAVAKAKVETAKTSGQKLATAHNKKPLHDVRVEDIHSESGHTQPPLQQQSPNKVSAPPAPNAAAMNKLSSPSIGAQQSAKYPSGKVSPLRGTPSPQPSHQKPAISIQEDEGGESSSYQDPTPSDSQQRSSNHVLNQETAEQLNEQQKPSGSSDYAIEEDGDEDELVETPIEEANRVGPSSSAADVANKNANTEFVGTQLNNDSEVTSQPARASSFMANRENEASASYAEEQEDNSGSGKPVEERKDKEEESEEQDQESDYQDDDYEEDNYEDDEAAFDSESQAAESQDQPKELARETSQ